jgi:hypothetical protein
MPRKGNRLLTGFFFVVMEEDNKEFEEREKGSADYRIRLSQVKREREIEILDR